MSLARRHHERALASLLAASAAPAVASGTGGRVAPPPPAEGAAATAYEHMLLQLREHRSRLKQIQSIERKIALKRELLPLYDAWIQGVLDGEAAGAEGVQDEVLTTVMLWRIDIGDFALGVRLARYALRWGLQLPLHIQRTLPTLLAEEVAEGALKLVAKGQPAPCEILLEVVELTEDQDMHDEVRAKLEKAVGVEFARLAEDAEALASAGFAGAQRAWRERALLHLNRALELNDRVGVKADIQRLQRELKKDAGAAAP